jgi:translocator protein
MKYDQLEKPPGTPPGWVFGPVWTILYVTMAVVLYRMVFVVRKEIPWWIIGLFGVQLALNLSWSPVFFEQQNIRLAFFIISVLVITLAVLVVGLHRYDPVGAWLLVPYLLWVVYAAYLNRGIMVLNRPSR